MNVEELYQEIILDHYREKHHAGLREPFGAEVHHVNPTCGDEVTLRVRLEGDGDQAVVRDVSYDGEGCSISQASTSVMTDLVIGRTVADAFALHEDFRAMMDSRGNWDADEERFADAIAFVGVAKFPARIKCALLGWEAFRAATLETQATTEQEDR